METPPLRIPPGSTPNRFGRAAIVVSVAIGGIGVVGVLAVVGLLLALSHIHINLGSIPGSAPSAHGMDMALSPDGDTAYVTEPTSDRLDVLRDGAVVARVPLGRTPTGLAVTPDGRQVWVADTGDLDDLGAPGSVTVVSSLTDTVITTISVGANPIDVAFSPDGSKAYVTDNGLVPGASGSSSSSPSSASSASLSSVSVIDTADFTVVGALAIPEESSPNMNFSKPTSVAVSPDGAKVWVSQANMAPVLSSSSDSVYVFDAASGAQLAHIEVGRGAYFMALSHDGDYAYVADKESCDVKEIDTTTYQVVATVRWPSSRGCPYGIAPGPDDSIVYTVTGSDHTLPHVEPRGRAFGSVDFAIARPVLDTNVGVDPVTVTMSRSGSTAYVVDADRPEVDLVDPGNGVVRTVVSLSTPAHAPEASSSR